jgi:NADP-dependent 3-hydroxy acid dehydrogenase YdfG
MSQPSAGVAGRSVTSSATVGASAGELAGRVAIVSGAASGMGQACAVALADRGAAVALVARREDRLNDLANDIGSRGARAGAFPADVTDARSVHDAVRGVESSFGPASILVNGAGVMLAQPFGTQSATDWARMIDTNLTGMLSLLQAALPGLEACAGTGGPVDIVNVSSIAARDVFPYYAVYGASKAAVSQLSANLRSELGPKGIRVTNIEPGFTRTELASHMDSARQDELEQAFASIDALSAHDVADLVAYVVTRPSHVNLSEIVMLPTQQVPGGLG